MLYEVITMSVGGTIFVTTVLSQGMLLSHPEIETRGFVDRENYKIHGIIKKDIESRINKLAADGLNAGESYNFV